MSPEEIRKLIGELKRDPIPMPKLMPEVLLADSYEILALDKTSAKKLTDEELKSLVAYGSDYIEQYLDGKYLFKMGSIDKHGRVHSSSGRTLLADFSEAGVFTEMSQAVTMLKAELSHRI